VNQWMQVGEAMGREARSASTAGAVAIGPRGFPGC
jgi:hypothetical protein